MGKIEKFEDLVCWQEARKLVKVVYISSSHGGIVKDCDLRNQLRRAVVSIMNNIAEGFGRFSNREKIRFMEYASASANEVKSLAYVVALDLNYWTELQTRDNLQSAESVKALTLGLVRHLSKNSPIRPKKS